MSTKEHAPKKGIMSFIKFSSFTSTSKDPDIVVVESNGESDNYETDKHSKTHVKLHRSSKRFSTEILRKESNSSDWVESMEHIKDKGKIKKKKKKKKKKGLHGELLEPIYTNPVRLNHAPSIADILTPQVACLKEPEITEIEVLHQKLNKAYQEIASLRALLTEKEHLIAVLTMGNKENRYNCYTSSDTDDYSKKNGAAKLGERKPLASLPFSLSTPSIPTSTPLLRTLPLSLSTPSLLSLLPPKDREGAKEGRQETQKEGETNGEIPPAKPPLRVSSVPSAPDLPTKKEKEKKKGTFTLRLPKIKRSLSNLVNIHIPSSSSTSPLPSPSNSSLTLSLPHPSTKKSKKGSRSSSASSSAPSSAPSSPTSLNTPAFPWSARKSDETLPSPTPSPTSLAPPPPFPSSTCSPSSTTLTRSPSATPPTRSPSNSSLNVTKIHLLPTLSPVMNAPTTPPANLPTITLTNHSPTGPVNTPRNPLASTVLSTSTPVPAPAQPPPTPVPASAQPPPTPVPTPVQPPPTTIPPSKSQSKSKSAIGPMRLSERIIHLASLNHSSPHPSTAPSTTTTVASPRLRHSAPSGSFSFISTFPNIPSKVKTFSPPPSPSRLLPLQSFPDASTTITVTVRPASNSISESSSPILASLPTPQRKGSLPPSLSLSHALLPSEIRPLSSSRGAFPRSDTPTPSPPTIPRGVPTITPPSPSQSLASPPAITSPRTMLVLAQTPPPNMSPRARTNAAVAESMPLVSQLQEKKNILLQIESCERAYLLQLSIIIEIFLKPLREQAQTPKPIISMIEVKSIFSDIEALWSASKYFLESLGSHIRRSDIDNMGAFFLRIVDTFRVYTGYVQNYYKAVSTIAMSKQSSPAFVAFLKKKEQEMKTGKELKILLLSPISRINQFTQQVKLLQEATTPTDPSFHSLGIAHAKMSHFAANLGERARIVEAKHKVQTIQDAMHGKFPSLVQTHRLYVMEGQLDLLIPAPNHAFSPRISRHSQAPSHLPPTLSAHPFSPNSLVISKSFYCFLFNDLLVLTKQKKHHYDFKRMYDIKDLDVQPIFSELGNLLQITHNASATTERVFMMDAKSSNKRDVWVTTLSKYIKETIEKDLLKRPAPRELSTAGGTIDFDTAEIVTQEHIGSGGSGCRVEKCSVDGKICAVKIMPLMEQSRNAQESFVNEIKIIEQLHHTHIIEYLGHCYKNDPTELWLFMEYYPVSLQEYLEQREGKCLKLSEIVHIGLFVAKGIEFLHTQKPSIMHRDLKTANILLSLDESYEVTNAKITDFDTAKIIYSDVLLHTSMGTPSYMAPEVMDISMMPCGASYSLKADVYSYGMILVELLTLKPPYHELKQPFQLTQKILCGEPPLIHHPNLGEMGELLDLVKKCTAYHPDKRPDADGVVKALKKIRQGLE